MSEHEYAIVLKGDSVEEVCTEFLTMIARAGELSTQNSNGGKPYAKLIMAGGGLGGFQPSFEVAWPENIVIGGKVPTSAKLTVVYTNLVPAASRKAAEKAQAATILADIAKLQERAKRLGVAVPSAGEEGE